jgi:hypothetical protein
MPSSRGVITADGIEFRIEHVCFAKERVDLQCGNDRLYLIEHAAALCAIFGVHSATIQGLTSDWDQRRSSHQVASVNGDTPQSVLGRSDGKIWGAMKKQVLRKALKNSVVEYLVMLNELKLIDDFGTKIGLFPAGNCEKMSVSCHHGNHHASVRFSIIDGVLKDDERDRILEARSVAVLGVWNSEAVWHALGDVLGDLVGLGKICANIDVELSPFYHNATINCVKGIVSGNNGTFK